MTMFKRPHPWIFALLTLALAAVASPAAADDWSDTDVFIGVDDAAQALEAGATFLDARDTEAFEDRHIPSAQPLPWQDLVDGEHVGALSDDDRRLERRLQQAGLSNDVPVIIYGGWADEGAWGEEGRLFWTLEYLGHDDVQILEGGLGAWRADGGDVSDGSTANGSGDFTVERHQELRSTTDEIADSLDDEAIQLLDTREPGEYRGTPKYGEQRGGHIPASTHLWWRQLFDRHGDLHAPTTVRSLLDHQSSDLDAPIAAYCTGGIRSGFVYAVLRALGADRPTNYDASMWEWTARPEAPLQSASP